MSVIDGQLKRLNIITGHYGTGKTCIAVNLALELRRRGEKVVLADLDIVNPYYRSSDYAGILEREGIKVISPGFANSNVDAPSIDASIYSIFDDLGLTAVMDAGGDDAGAAVLGRFSSRIRREPYSMFYVINMYRPFTALPEDCALTLRQIEQAARLKATAIINNSHLGGATVAADVAASASYAEEVAKLCGLEIAFTSVKKGLESSLEGIPGGVLPIDIFSSYPVWE